MSQLLLQVCRTPDVDQWNATDCTASGGWTGTQITQRRATSSALTANTTFYADGVTGWWAKRHTTVSVTIYRSSPEQRRRRGGTFVCGPRTAACSVFSSCAFSGFLTRKRVVRIARMPDQGQPRRRMVCCDCRCFARGRDVEERSRATQLHEARAAVLLSKATTPNQHRIP